MNRHTDSRGVVEGDCETEVPQRGGEAAAEEGAGGGARAGGQEGAAI